jgi:hypothetical protein
MSKLQELNAGISDDPMAKLIAMFGGSKVQQKLTGGSASNNPADRDPGSVGGGGGFSGGEGGGGGGAMSDLNPRDRFSVQMALRGTPVATEQNTFDMVDERKGFVGAAKSAVSKRARSLNTGKGFFQAASIAGLNFAFPMGAISKVAGVASLATDIADEMGIEVGPAKTPNEDREGRATGGSIRRMAMGGAVSPRDRVPALLEPGEFVIRRPAAKAIGGAALNQMNATGRPPQISVNLNNQGAPKDVQAAPPKMNGDKIILDIITRDLRNNGAIKKTLRRGK